MRTFLRSVLPVSFLSMLLGGCSGSVDADPTYVAALPDGAASPNPAAPPRGPATRAVNRSIDLDLDANVLGADPSQATEFFVWTREWTHEGEESAVTHHLDATGREVEELDGIVVATASGTWQWREESRPIPTVPCEYYEDSEGHEFAAEPVEPGTATGASLRHIASGVEQVIVEPGDDLLGNADIQHDVVVVGSVGPYVFIEESTYVFTCGAHGNTGVSTLIWNAATGATVAAPLDLGPLQAPRAAAIRELTDEDDDVFPATEDNVELTELVPKFATDGTLVLGLKFTAPTCYACTRGGWGSYTKSTLVDSAAIPELLAPFATPPRAVRAFLRSHPDATLGGWSAR